MNPHDMPWYGSWGGQHSSPEECKLKGVVDPSVTRAIPEWERPGRRAKPESVAKAKRNRARAERKRKQKHSKGR